MQSNKTLPEFSWEVFSWQMLILFSIILWIYAIRHFAKHSSKSKIKAIWIFIILFLPVVGAILYLNKYR